MTVYNDISPAHNIGGELNTQLGFFDPLFSIV